MAMLWRTPHHFLAALLTCVLFALSAYSQDGKGPKSLDEGKRPRSIDEGNTTVSGRTSPTKKAFVTTPVPRRPAYNWVIIRPDIDNAEVRIDGKPLPKSKDDDFRAELPVGRKYSVSVTAGEDYLPFRQSYTMKAKQPEIIEPLLPFKFGTVKILTAEEALEGARVLIDGKPQKVQLDTLKSMLTIDRVEPGKRIITFDHPDYVLYERNATIAADTEYTWSFIPARPLVELEIQTEPHAKVYIDDEPRGDVTSDGRFKLSDVKIGAHQVKLVKNGYEEYRATHQFIFAKPVRISHRLQPRQPSTDFQTNFKDADAGAWALPRGAKIETDRLTVAGAAALARPQAVVYWDFDMQFHLRLESDGGAAWALRADDPNNYYLFHLSGPKGRSRTATFTTYVVRDGKLDLSKTAVSPVDTGIAAETGYEYTVVIEARGNVINHKVIPAANRNRNDRDVWGREVNLGSFTDAQRLFLFGGFGFRAVGAEIFSVSELYVKRR